MASLDVSGQMTRVRERPRVGTAAALTAIVAGGGAVLTALGLLMSVPNTFADEVIYAELARNLGTSGTFEILGSPFPALTYGPAYVALLAPVFRFAGTAREAYMLTRGLNAFLFASATIPTFLIAARVVSRRSAYVVAAAAIALPASIFTTKIMTESLAYVVVLWTVLAALRVCARPSRTRQATLLVCLVAAPAVRFQLIVLAPAVCAACVIAMDGSIRARARALSSLFVGTGTILAFSAVALHLTADAGGGAGTHGLAAGGFSIRRFAVFLLGSIGALDLYTGVLPFAAFLVLAVAVRRRAAWLPARARPLVAVTGAVALATLATGSAYLATVPATARPPVPTDRYAFYVVPLLLIAFAVWIEGATRDPHGIRWIAIGACAMPLAAAGVGIESDPHGTVNGLAFLPWIAFGGGRSLLVFASLAICCVYCGYLLVRRSQRTPALIPGQVQLLGALLAGREDTIQTVVLADDHDGTFVPKPTARPSATPKP